MAIWRRIWLIPFTVTIPAEKLDPRIGEKLVKEAPGIMAWCLKGLQRYQENGSRLIKPDKVSFATEEYRADQDVLGDFLTEWCTIQPGAVVYASDLYRSYTEWCTGNDEEAMTKTAFGNLIKIRFQKGKDRAGYYYKGLKLADQGTLFLPTSVSTGTQKTRSTNPAPIENVTSYDKSFDFTKKPHIEKIESFTENPNNLSQLVTFSKEAQIENPKNQGFPTSVSTGKTDPDPGPNLTKNPYMGMNRSQLTAIRLNHEPITDQEAYQAAWKAAEKPDIPWTP